MSAIKRCVVRPFRRLLEETAPAVLALNSRVRYRGAQRAEFSRINRDIRFAKDKTPYRPQMYLKFAVPFAGDGETGRTLRRTFGKGGDRGIPDLFGIEI